MSSRLGAKDATAPIIGPATKAANTSVSAAAGLTTPLPNAISSRISDIGATSERRRLSIIFQRLIARSL
jgi:hypothetical protein